MKYQENIGPNLAAAICEVMEGARGLDKAARIGHGSRSYKGVNDKDVKLLLQPLMQKAGLSIMPIDYETNTTIGGEKDNKVFFEVKAYYRLMHKSGEWSIICGTGHGIDYGDKAAGKATTYALKNALIYAFMIPSGHIDDTDATHSDAYNQPKPAPQPKKLPTVEDKNIGALVEHANKEGWNITKLQSIRALTAAQVETIKPQLNAK